MNLTDIIRQHGKSVALVFSKMGIEGPVTVETLMYATLIGQHEFIDALEAQIAQDAGEVSYIGDTLTREDFKGIPGVDDSFDEKKLPAVVVTSKKVKTTLWDVLNTVFATVGGLAGNRNATIHKAPTPPADEKKKTNYFLIAALVLIAVLFGIVLFKSKK